MNDQDIYDLYSEQFRTIDDNLDDLVKQATNFEDANRIIENWKQANLNNLRARNKLFSDHEAEIKGLVEDFAAAQEEIEDAIADLEDDSTTIDQVSKIISTGVSIGTELNTVVPK